MAVGSVGRRGVELDEIPFAGGTKNPKPNPSGLGSSTASQN